MAGVKDGGDKISRHSGHNKSLPQITACGCKN